MPLSSRRARKIANMRQTYAGGRPRIPRPCPRCGAECVSARQAQAHCAAPESAKVCIDLALVSREIDQQRKLIDEEQDKKGYSSDAVRALRQSHLLDWIQAEIKRSLATYPRNP